VTGRRGLACAPVGLGVVVAALALVTAAGAVRVADARPWAWLGVRIRDMSEQEMDDIAKAHGIREGFGVVIVDVMEDSPAQKGGIRPGDIVVAFDGRPIVDTRLLQRLIAAAPLDVRQRVTVLRPEGRRTLDVRLAAMPPAVAGERVAAEFGFLLREAEATPGLAATRPVAATPTVAVVIRGGAAERAGLAVGDVLLQVGDRPVISTDAAREALAAMSVDAPLRLTVRRDGARVELTLRN
jgi:serine protease Do